MLKRIAAAVLVALAAAPVSGQGLGLPDSAVLVVDPNRLFSETAFGQRVAAEVETEGTALAGENRRIEAELTSEEKALTEQRSRMTPEAFRAAADAFDGKVQRIRAEQETKARKLAEESDNAQRRFLGVARPVLETLMVESGAAVLLDTRAVLLSAGTVDVTDEAVRRIDQAIGDGSDLGVRPPVAPTAPEPAAQDPATPGTPPD
jgi:Skp family chaperone for outer membrane proteins